MTTPVPWRTRRRRSRSTSFHVAGHLGDAVDRVRRAEHRRLAGADDQRLKGSRYRWLTNPENMDEERWEQFAELRDSALQWARKA